MDRHDREDETQLAALWGKRAQTPLPRSLPPTPAERACWKDPSRLFYVVGGLVIAVGSLLLGVLPGPGTLTFFVGLGMIAGAFCPIARLLDWAEVWARKLGRWVGGVWRSSAAGKASVVVAAAICAAAVLYAA